MSHAFEYLYLHGFCSDTASKKGSFVKQRLRAKGIELHMLDVRGGRRHEDARVTIGLETLHAYYTDHGKPLRLIGSSMGGLISATYASQHPDHIDRVVLLNPAVNLKVLEVILKTLGNLFIGQETWRTIAGPNDPTALDKWKENGTMMWPAGKDKEEVQIPFAYIEDSLQYESFPKISCPSLVFVGSRDDYVPPKNGYMLQLEQENPELMEVIEVDDNHDLLRPDTLDKISEHAAQFFA